MKKTFDELIKEEKRRYGNEWRAKNRDHINAYHRQWREKNKERLKKNEENYWLRKALKRQAEESGEKDA